MKSKLIMAAIALSATSFVGLSAGVAGASNNANGTALYTNQFFCGGAQDLSQPTDGFVNFHVTGDTVTLNYHVKGGLPNATDYVYGYDSFCTNDAFLGSFTTNSNGVGNATFTYTKTTGSTSVWTFAFEQNATSVVDTESLLATP
jgi:hypothetical protein